MIILLILLLLSLLYLIVKNISYIHNKIKEKYIDNELINWTNDEYLSLFIDYKNCKNKLLTGTSGTNFQKLDIKKLPYIELKYIKSFNWAANNNYLGKSIVSSVKNQGFCGSCYAFVTIGVIESAYYLYLQGFGSVIELSVQQILDCTSSNMACDPNKPSKACGGGDLIDIVNTYFTEPQKIALEKYYPYTCLYNTIENPPPIHKDGSKSIQLQNYNYNDGNTNCITKTNELNTYFYNYIIIEPITVIIIDDEKYLKQAIYKYGPIYIGYFGCSYKYGDIYPFKIYNNSSGIYKGPISFPGAIEKGHIMLLTGWDKYQDEEYWIVKNSWGNKWGYDGYVRFPIGKNIFSKMYAINFNRKCETINTIISIASKPFYIEKEDLYVAEIIFKAFRQIPNNRINLLIKTIEPENIDNSILPIYNDKSTTKFEILCDKNRKNIQDNNSYYYDKINNKFKNKVNGLWFQGSVKIEGDCNFKIDNNNTEWIIYLQVLDINNKILYQDSVIVYWNSIINL